MAHFILCHKKVTAIKLANLFFKNIMSLHEVTDSIITDCGSNFISRFWKILYHCFKMEQKLFAAFYPQTNRQTERTNWILEQ